MAENGEHNSTYEKAAREFDKNNAVFFGPYTSAKWRSDPKRMLFEMSRMKFCAKMLANFKNVLNVGCGDAFLAPILLQSVQHMTGIDIVSDVISYNTEQYSGAMSADFAVHDIVKSPMQKNFDAAISLDVFEHINPADEEAFVTNIAASLLPHSVFIVGTPNVTAFPYAGPIGKKEHINNKDHDALRSRLLMHFHNVFMFSMNDEVLHTGFHPMGHYIFGMAIDPRT